MTLKNQHIFASMVTIVCYTAQSKKAIKLCGNCFANAKTKTTTITINLCVVWQHQVTQISEEEEKSAKSLNGVASPSDTTVTFFKVAMCSRKKMNACAVNMLLAWHYCSGSSRQEQNNKTTINLCGMVQPQWHPQAMQKHLNAQGKDQFTAAAVAQANKNKKTKQLSTSVAWHPPSNAKALKCTGKMISSLLPQWLKQTRTNKNKTTISLCGLACPKQCKCI